MLAVQIASGILVVVAIVTAWRLRSIIKGTATAEQKEKKEKLLGLILTIVSIILAALQFFVAPTIENNTINQISTTLNQTNTTLNQQIERITNIQGTVDIITNNGAIFNGPVEQVNVYGPQGGGSNQTPAETVEEPPLASIEQFETVESWPVGWSDSNGGRTAYTLDEINNGALDDAIVFNSISDGPIGHEFNFVGARENSGINEGRENVWNANSIQVEPGKTYYVRIFAHNNSAIATNIAHDVSERFVISDPKHVTGNDLDLAGFDSSNGYYGVAVHGYISSSNSNPAWYSDGVKFVSDRPFHLVYVPGTARFENNGIGNAENQGYRLSDDIMDDGVLIGYDKIDGNIPACYQYSSYTTILVMPVFD